MTIWNVSFETTNFNYWHWKQMSLMNYKISMFLLIKISYNNQACMWWIKWKWVISAHLVWGKSEEASLGKISDSHKVNWRFCVISTQYKCNLEILFLKSNFFKEAKSSVTCLRRTSSVLLLYAINSHHCHMQLQYMCHKCINVCR